MIHKHGSLYLNCLMGTGAWQISITLRSIIAHHASGTMLIHQLIPTITCMSDKHLVTKCGTHFVGNKTLDIATDGFALMVIYDKSTTSIFQLELNAFLLVNIILDMHI